MFLLEILLIKTKTVVWMCSVEKVFLEISQNSQENTCAKVSLLIKLQACNLIKKETLTQVFFMNFAKFLRTPNFIKKETLVQVFSCDFCEYSKNTFFYRTPPVAASVKSYDQKLSQIVSRSKSKSVTV